MYLFETSIFKTWRFSVINQNVLKINQTSWGALFTPVWCGDVNVWAAGSVHACVGACFCDHAKQMLCGNEMAERLSWISWVAAYQDGVLLLSPPLHVWPRIKKTSSAVTQSVEGGLHTHIYRFSPLESVLLTSPEPLRVAVGGAAGSWVERRLCVSVCTQWHPFIFVPLFECDCCVLKAVLHMGQTCWLRVRKIFIFPIFFFTMGPFSAVCASMFTVKLEKVGTRALQPDGLTIPSTVVQSENSERKSMKECEVRGRVGRELAVCQEYTLGLCTVQSWRTTAQREGGREGGREGRQRDRQQWPDGALFVLK